MSMENWIKTTRETVSRFFHLESLSTQFHELKDVLQTARCAVILENDTLGHLDRDIDQVFYDACRLAFDSRDLMQLFESKCERALFNVDTIVHDLKNNRIEQAAIRLYSMYEMSHTMEEKSYEMIQKFTSFSEKIHEFTKLMSEQNNADKRRLGNLLVEIDLQLMKSRRELKEHAERKEQAKKEKELQEKKMDAARHKSSMEEVLSLFSSLTFKITSYFETKVEVWRSDTKEEEKSLSQSVEALKLATKNQQDSVQEVITRQTERTNMVKEMSNMDVLVGCMQKSVRLMDSLKVTVDDMSSFWKHLQECCSTVSEATKFAMVNIKTDSKAESIMDNSGVKKSMEYFDALWKVLKEVCTESKEELKKVAEALKSAYTKMPSPEDAKQHV